MSRKKNIQVWSVLCLFVVALYANTLGHQYAYDDRVVTTENAYVQEGVQGIPKILQGTFWQGFLINDPVITQEQDHHYRTFTLITFAIENSLFGNNPHVSHAINVLLYALSIVLLFEVLSRILRGPTFFMALTTSLLFAAHPVHVEVVANIKGREDILLFLFLMLILFFTLEHVAKGGRWRLCVVGLCYLLALMSKESAILFLGILPLTIYFFTEKNVRYLAKLILCLLPGLVVFFSARYLVLGHFVGDTNIPSPLNNALIAYPSHVASALLILYECVELLLVPHPLAYDYSFSQVPYVGFDNLFVLLSLLASAAAVVYVCRNFKKHNVVTYALLFFAMTYVLTSNLFFVIGVTMAERFLYLPSLAFCLLLVFFLSRYVTPTSGGSWFKTNRLLTAVLTVVLLLYSVKVITRNTVWENSQTLFTNDYPKEPDNPRMSEYYSNTLLKDDSATVEDFDAVIDHLKMVTEQQTIDKVKDTYLKSLSRLHYNKAIHLRGKGNLSGAIEDGLIAIEYHPQSADAHNNLGIDYQKQNQLDKAKSSFAEAAKYKPNVQHFYHLGTVCLSMNDHAGAYEAYSKVLSMNPQFSAIYMGYGVACYYLKKYDEAITYFNKEADVSQNIENQIKAYENLSIIYKETGQNNMAQQAISKMNALRNK